MNEVTRIHLGRQPFTVSVEAHKALKAYLAAIGDEVGDKEVVDEVELRMAELLAERGINSEKVVLPEDVDYLKEQLGNPTDFKEDAEEAAAPSQEQATRQLFRDTENGMIAGVAAGLAAYFGLDVTLVRILFVIGALAGGWAILIYIALWLLVPAAKTTSERLRMKGTPVTVESLKGVVERADVKGAARQANGLVMSVINGVFRIVIKVIGLGFIIGGLAVIFGLIAIGVYMAAHGGQLFQENLFPVGRTEDILAYLVLGLTALLSVFGIVCGLAFFKRRWPINAWVTGVLAGIFLLGSAATTALIADATPRVNQRYQAGLHTTAVKNIQPFTQVNTTGDIDVSYISSPHYAVNYHYFGNPDLSKIKIKVDNGTLYIDSTALDQTKHCTMLCLFPRYDMTVDVYAPNIQNFKVPPSTDIFYPPQPGQN